MTNLTPERRAELRGLLHNHNADPGDWCCDTLPQAAMDALPALLDAADERDRLRAERDAFTAGMGFTPDADLVELVEPLMERIADAVEHRQCAEELAWEKRQHEARMAEARESHERFLRDAHRVSDAYNTVARRVYRAAMKRRKTVRITDLLDGQPMVWPDGDE